VEWIEERWRAIGTLITTVLSAALRLLWSSRRKSERGAETVHTPPVSDVEPVPKEGEHGRTSTDARPSNSEGLDLEGTLISYFDGLGTGAREDLKTGQRLKIYNFDDGWRLLFRDLFNPKASHEKRLRDFSNTGHMGLSFGGYNFDTYPDVVKFYVNEYLNSASRPPCRIQFLVLCNPNTSFSELSKSVLSEVDLSSTDSLSSLDKAGFILAERFFLSLVALKCDDGSRMDNVKLFNRWRQSKGRENIDIRISNTTLAKKCSFTKSESPFNVYGDRAVSVSVVKPPGTKPVPHLEVDLDAISVNSFAAEFDGLWEGSRELKDKAFGTSSRDLKGLGKSGELFKEWANFQG
jgi:hypothetical protein